jgi:uncharacterized protein YndB with AHSA1/START domain
MTYEMSADGRGFTITRHIPAPRARVFAAWTQPDRLRWFSNAPDGVDDKASVELRPGGVWRVHLYEGGESTKDYYTGGVYAEVVPDERLVFAHGAVADGDVDAFPELDPADLDGVPRVTITLRDEVVDGVIGTEMTFHVGFAETMPVSEIARWFGRGIRDGWSDKLDALAPSLVSAPGR